MGRFDYPGSIVHLYENCPICGSEHVITSWLYYYGPTYKPNDGEWGVKCFTCNRQFSYLDWRASHKRNWPPI